MLRRPRPSIEFRIGPVRRRCHSAEVSDHRPAQTTTSTTDTPFRDIVQNHGRQIVKAE
jgi:hypothetical protein